MTIWVTIAMDEPGRRWTTVDRTPRSGREAVLVPPFPGLTYKRGVTGSNPVPPTSKNKPRSDHATGLRATNVPLAWGSDPSDLAATASSRQSTG